VKVGDVVNVTGPFAGKFQGQVIVRFAGAPGVAPAITGPFGGSLVVPHEAETGACTIEVDGRIVHGASCVVSKGLSGGRAPARAPEQRWARGWKGVGPKTSQLAGVEEVARTGAAVLFVLVAAAAAGAWWLFSED
jgi:hypothetical protein